MVVGAFFLKTIFYFLYLVTMKTIIEIMWSLEADKLLKEKSIQRDLRPTCKRRIDEESIYINIRKEIGDNLTNSWWNWVGKKQSYIKPDQDISRKQ